MALAVGSLQTFLAAIDVESAVAGEANECGFQFGSIHESCHFVFCDGSIHVVNYMSTPTTWLNLCTMNDGNGVDANGWN